MNYRAAEFGVELIEDVTSTFIPEDRASAAWVEFENWCAAGNAPVSALPRPGFPPRGATRDALWIIGAGGFGREVFSLAQSCHGFKTDWRIAGFLNDIPGALDGFAGLPPIRGNTDYVPQPGDAFVCAIGDVTGRAAVCAKFQSRGARFVNLISRKAMISGAAKLGEGVIVEAFTGVAADARVGNFTTLLSHTTVGHDVKIGSSVQISSYCDIHGWAEIGDGCLVGSHAVILTKVKIGAGATIGAGSVVISDVPPGATVFGVPAKRIQ